MIKKFPKKYLSVFLGIILVILLTLLIRLTLTRQNSRNEASAVPSLYFSPSSSSTNPIIKNLNETFTLDLMIDPGDTLASFVTFSIQYDPQKFTILNEDDVKINITAFPVTIEGPYLHPDSIEGTVSIGSDPTKGISAPTKVASITFKTIGSTNGSNTIINHRAISTILSIGANESASQNVLGLTVPAVIQVNIPPPADTELNLNLFLHGIGSSGDNRNPASDFSNKNPLHPERKALIEVYNNKNILIATKEASINYASESGNFTGSANAGKLSAGGYTVKIKTEQHLKLQIPGIQNVASGGALDLPTATLVSGDVNNDNKLDILDYNILYGCYTSDLMPNPKNCNAEKALKADLNDEGKVNLFDLNLFIRELSVQTGL